MRCVFIPLALITLSANAQTTAFTYQGEMKNGAQLASGLHDLRFRLFDAPTNGAQIGATVCINNVSVVDGRFSTTVDFGQQFLTSSPRYLEIEARRDTGLDCANATGFAVSGSRQEITDAPLAIHANSASTLVDAAGTPVVSASNDGKIGIGTTSPSAYLHIQRPNPTIFLKDTTGSTAGTYISYLNSSGGETGWFGFGHPNSSIMSVANGRANGHINVHPGSGNVGIGTSAPAAKLDVLGDIRMGASGQHFATRASEHLRVVRGEINSAGTRIRGAGFTSSRVELGKYRITFTTPFPTAPTVMASAWRGSQSCAANVDSVDTASAVIVTYSTFADDYADVSFEFTVLGTR